MKIAIIGTGYVGTVAGACFAEAGNSVVCVDKDPRKVEALKGGQPLIFEPGLEELIRRNSARKRLSFLREAAQDVARAMASYTIIVNKSTVPVGTHKQVVEWVSGQTRVPFDVVSNPEFLREGAAIQDFLYPERVVIGTSKSAVFEKMKKLYAPFLSRKNGHILWTNPVTGELLKYACNAFLATRISFMNELAQLCEKTGADVEAIRQGMGLDSRFGSSRPPKRPMPSRKDSSCRR